MAGIVMFGFYDIAWPESRLRSEHWEWLEWTLRKDLYAGFQVHDIDVMLLSECGDSDERSKHAFQSLLREVCGPDFSVTSQGQYACIVRTSTIHVTQEPCLIEPLSFSPEHECPKCQHLRITLKSGVAYKDIDVYNVHLPLSTESPLNTSIRQDVFRWFAVHAGESSLIGGNLNASLFTLASHLGTAWDIYALRECKHGEASVGRNINAESIPCGIASTSEKQRMCIVRVFLDKWTFSNVRAFYASHSFRAFVRTDDAEQHSAHDLALQTSCMASQFASSKTDLASNTDLDDPQDVEAYEAEQTPYADAMLEAFGERQDADGQQHTLLTDLQTHLWKLNSTCTSGKKKLILHSRDRPRSPKVRLDRLIEKAIEVRRRYHMQLTMKAAFMTRTAIVRSVEKKREGCTISG